jgi:DNA-binding response OmpR family regulator
MIAKGLREQAYAVDIARDGVTAAHEAAIHDYDAIILDVMLPGRDGFSVCGELRRNGSAVPILMLTARDDVEARVAGLDAGADDYLIKPFAVAELVARVRALLRRNTPGAQPVLTLADLRLDPATRAVTRTGQPIELTAKEYALLEFFLRNPGRVLSRSLIAQHVWGVAFDTFTNVIDVYVNYLRRKIDAGFEPKLVHTVRGAGYVLRVPEPETASHR